MRKSELRQMIIEEIASIAEADIKVKKRGDTIVVDKDVPGSMRYLSGKKLKVLDVKKVRFASGEQIRYIIKDKYGEEEIPHRFVAK
jgi:hypothetical protein